MSSVLTQWRSIESYLNVNDISIVIFICLLLVNINIDALSYALDRISDYPKVAVSTKKPSTMSDIWRNWKTSFVSWNDVGVLVGPFSTKTSQWLWCQQHFNSLFQETKGSSHFRKMNQKLRDQLTDVYNYGLNSSVPSSLNSESTDSSEDHNPDSQSRVTFC